MKRWSLIGLRLLLACLFGMLVTWTALLAGRREVRTSILGYSQESTSHYLIQINKAIVDYRLKNHTLPRSMNQLKTSDSDYSQRPDGWGRPFVYTVQGTHYFVISYGRDGKPGGMGWDTDLTSDNPYPLEAGPTFSQFLKDPETRDMIQSAYISGFVAGLLCLVTVRPKILTWRSSVGLIVQVAATLAAAAWVAMVITALHVPSGH